MAIFTSDQLANGGLPVKSNNSGIGSITTKITLPAGTAIGAGDVFKFCRVAGNIHIKDVLLRTSDLDTGTSITGSLGILRATVDPSKPFNAQTNPYITGALSADDDDVFAATADIQTALRSGGTVQRTTFVQPDGVADVALTIALAPAGNPATTRTIEITFEYVGETTIPGEFSGGDAYNYTNETA